VADFDTNVIDWEVPVEVSIRNGGPDREQFEAQVLENLPFLESLFGPFPYDRLGISVMDRSGEFGYSSPTRIVMPEWMSESRLVHELSHQWAGNAVAVVEEGSNWLIEGLAVYVEALWAESLRDDIDVDAISSRLDGRVPPVTRTLDGVDSTDDVYDETTYDRAALFYHALRLEIGDDAFFVTLREFIQRNLHGTVVVEDLQAIAEEVAEQDLDQFFNAWVREPEVPVLPTSAG
jgi:aminopeptidase N